MALVSVSAGCAPITVGTDFHPEASFSGYRTFAWMTENQPRTGDPRLDDSEFFDSQVRSAVERHFGAKGFEKTPVRLADFLIDYHAAVDYRVEVVDGYGYDAHGYIAEVGKLVEYEQGTLLIDVIDPETRKLVWRGWAESNIEGVIGDRQRMEERIDKVADRIIARFPPSETQGR